MLSAIVQIDRQGAPPVFGGVLPLVFPFGTWMSVNDWLASSLEKSQTLCLQQKARDVLQNAETPSHTIAVMMQETDIVPTSATDIKKWTLHFNRNSPSIFNSIHVVYRLSELCRPSQGCHNPRTN